MYEINVCMDFMLLYFMLCFLEKCTQNAYLYNEYKLHVNTSVYKKHYFNFNPCVTFKIYLTNIAFRNNFQKRGILF